jgi:hypothetical protein
VEAGSRLGPGPRSTGHEARHKASPATARTLGCAAGTCAQHRVSTQDRFEPTGLLQNRNWNDKNLSLLPRGSFGCRAACRNDGTSGSSRFQDFVLKYSSFFSVLTDATS